MKKRKIVKGMSIAILLLFLCRGYVYRTIIIYEPLDERHTTKLEDENLIALLQEEESIEVLSLNDIARISNNLSCRKLQFTTQSFSSNPNEVLQTGKANCIGYAALCTAIARYLIKENEASEKFEVKHLVGKMNFLNFDLHSLFSDPFFRDHDYVQIRNLENGHTIWLDPSISDYLWIRNVSSSLYQGT